MLDEMAANAGALLKEYVAPKNSGNAGQMFKQYRDGTPEERRKLAESVYLMRRFVERFEALFRVVDDEHSCV
jgi:hypothetical protein